MNDYPKFLTDMILNLTEMYRHSWDERNGGNVSMLLEDEEAKAFLGDAKVLRTYPTGFDCPSLAGKYFLVTGTGKYFRNVERDPEGNLGIIRISGDGKSYDLMWGYSHGGKCTSELPAHLMSHQARLAVNPDNRIIMHCHPNNLLAMTFVHDLDEKAFTLSLWRMISEGVVVFPEGVAVLPWMLCGTNEIGIATAEKMADRRLVVWSQHGIYGAGNDLDEAFGLIETAEKCAEIYMKIAHLPIKQQIEDDQLRSLAEFWHLTPREGYLK